MGISIHSVWSEWPNAVAADVRRRLSESMAQTHVCGYRVLKLPLGIRLEAG